MLHFHRERIGVRCMFTSFIGNSHVHLSKKNIGNLHMHLVSLEPTTSPPWAAKGFAWTWVYIF